MSKRDKVWLDARINEFPNLVQMALDEGFLNAPKAGSFTPNLDNQYDLLAGEERLKALEKALSSAHSGWMTILPKVRRAGSGSREIPFMSSVDLESIPDGGAAFAKVWSGSVGRIHRRWNKAKT